MVKGADLNLNLDGDLIMKTLKRYLLAAFAVTALSLTLANATALAICTIDVQDEYTCYPTGEDEQYCYYTCYCKTSSAACEAALIANGYEILN
jgi:hypothetical protein